MRKVDGSADAQRNVNCTGSAQHHVEEVQPDGLPSFSLKVRPCEHGDTAAAVLPDKLVSASAGADPPLVEQLRPLLDDELRYVPAELLCRCVSDMRQTVHTHARVGAAEFGGCVNACLSR